MAQTALVIDGLADLKALLYALPRDLEAAGAEIIRDTAEAARAEIYAEYVVRSGELQRHLQPVQYSENGMKAKIKNTSEYAAPYEFGSAGRFTHRSKWRGMVRPHKRLVPVARRGRRGMVQRMIDLLRGKGLEVSGQ